MNELVTTGDGVAIIEQGMSFGGGNLQYFGINSNTSANGFLKCTYKKKVCNNELKFFGSNIIFVYIGNRK